MRKMADSFGASVWPCRVVIWEPIGNYLLRCSTLAPVCVGIAWAMSLALPYLNLLTSGDAAAVGLTVSALLVPRRRALIVSNYEIGCAFSQSSIAKKCADFSFEVIAPTNDLLAWRISSNQGSQHLSLMLLDRRQVEFDFRADDRIVEQLTAILLRTGADCLA
jgi:hypothetical protein